MTSNEPMMTVDRLDELMRTVFEVLIQKDRNAHSREVLNGVAAKIKLTPVELELNASKIPRWETNVRFHTTDCVKAGYLQKSSGYWKLTDLGLEALKQPKGELIRSAKRSYRAWKAKQGEDEESTIITPPPDKNDGTLPPEKKEVAVRREAFERAEEEAQNGIENHIHQLSPYEFQDLIGHLLTAMGYFVAHTAPPGPDGGVDLVVYKDPLGTVTPRIKVQAKHRRDSKVNAKEIRELQGLLQHNDEVGLIVSTGGFTSDAAREARTSAKHVDLIDLERFVVLWQQHYNRITEEGRNMLPLAPLYFLAPSED